jgi:hypothetical protein
MILKGQNFRIFSGDSAIGMATNCTVTLTGNSEDASHKDIVGLASLPTIVSKGWQVSVESLDVTDVAAMLTAIKNMTPFTLRWDETSTTDNQTGLGAAFARTGQAYLNDATFTWNDRANSTKSLQFTGTGPLTKVTNPTTDVITVNNTFTKGQFVRLFISSDNTAAPAKVVAAARQLSLHISMTLESATTKDTDGDWDVQEPTGLSYDITSNALMRSNDTITSAVGAQSVADIEDIYEGAVPVKWAIANVSGANQRTKGAVIVSGSCVITSLVLNGPDRQNADYNATLNGYGAYSVGV